MDEAEFVAAVVNGLDGAYRHALDARDDLAHLADWAGEPDCPAVTSLEASIDALQAVLSTLRGQSRAEVRAAADGSRLC